MSAESVVVHFRTHELLIGLIHSYTKASKGPTCSDIENKDLSSKYRVSFRGGGAFAPPWRIRSRFNFKTVRIKIIDITAVFS